MYAHELYARIEKDIIKPQQSDKWFSYMEEVSRFICDNFKKRSIGLVCDNSEKIKKIYTAVFPTDHAMRFVIEKGKRDVLLFTHHPMKWNIEKQPPFQNMNKYLLKKLKDKKISVYNLNVPLDNFSEYSTSLTLSKAIGINPIKPFGQYFGALCGVFGDAEFKTVDELSAMFKEILGHKTSLYNYGDIEIRDGIIAVIAGGGNDIEMLKEVAKQNVNTLVTGITACNDYSKPAHEYARQNKINILGGTHYSTEKFACIAMCNYFKKIGIKSEFINGAPNFKDL